MGADVVRGDPGVAATNDAVECFGAAIPVKRLFHFPNSRYLRETRVVTIC